MPKIIDYATPQKGVSYVEQRPSVISTGQEGRDLQQIGRGITDIALGVTDAIHKRQLQKDNTQMHVDFADVDFEFQSAIDEGVKSGNLDVQKISNDLNERFNEIGQRIETGQGKDAFTSRQASLRSQIMRHAAHSKAVLEGTQATEAMKGWWTTKGNALQKNPGAFGEAIAAQSDFISDLRQDYNLSVDQANKMIRGGNDELAKNSVQGYLNQNNPYLVKKLLNDGVYDDYMDPDTRATMMNRAQNQIDAALSKVQNIESYRIKDPYRFMQENGIAPPSLDLMKSESIVKRMNFIEENKKRFGYFKGEIPFMTPLEARDFGRLFDKMPSKDAAGLLQNISINMPEKLFSSFSKQIFEERKAIGVAMALSRDDIVTSEKIIAGKQLLADPKGKGIGSLDAPSMGKIKETFNAYMGNSIHDSGASESFMDAAFSHYAKTMFDKNGDLSVIDESTFKESIKSVMGPVGEVNGSNIVSFKGDDGKFVKADDLEDEFDSLDPEIIKKTQSDVPRLLNKEPLDVVKSRGRISPISVGDGLYILKRDEELLLDKDGNPYEIDMKKYLKESKKKKGEGFVKKISDFFKRAIDEPILGEAKAGR